MELLQRQLRLSIATLSLDNDMDYDYRKQIVAEDCEDHLITYDCNNVADKAEICI
jgi:hypothetical protein